MAVAQNLATAAHGTIEPGYIERLKGSRVGDAVLEHAIEAYARQAYADEDERDDFILQMSEPPYGPQVKKAVLDVVFTAIAATELPTDEAFKAVVDFLEIAESDELVRSVKRTCLQIMTDNDSDFDGSVSEQQFRTRMAYVDECIGIE